MGEVKADQECARCRVAIDPPAIYCARCFGRSTIAAGTGDGGQRGTWMWIPALVAAVGMMAVLGWGVMAARARGIPNLPARLADHPRLDPAPAGDDAESRALWESRGYHDIATATYGADVPVLYAAVATGAGADAQQVLLVLTGRLGGSPPRLSDLSERISNGNTFVVWDFALPGRSPTTGSGCVWVGPRDAGFVVSVDDTDRTLAACSQLRGGRPG